MSLRVCGCGTWVPLQGRGSCRSQQMLDHLPFALLFMLKDGSCQKLSSNYQILLQHSQSSCTSSTLSCSTPTPCISLRLRHNARPLLVQSAVTHKGLCLNSLGQQQFARCSFMSLETANGQTAYAQLCLLFSFRSATERGS